MKRNGSAEESRRTCDTDRSRDSVRVWSDLVSGRSRPEFSYDRRVIAQPGLARALHAVAGGRVERVAGQDVIDAAPDFLGTTALVPAASVVAQPASRTPPRAQFACGTGNRAQRDLLAQMWPTRRPVFLRAQPFRARASTSGTGRVAQKGVEDVPEVVGGEALQNGWLAGVPKSASRRGHTMAIVGWSCLHLMMPTST